MRASQDARWKRAKAESALRLRPGQSGRAQSDSRRARRKYKQYDESVQSERAANAAAELERRRALRREQDELMRKPWQAPKIADGAGVRPKTPRVRARAQRPNSAQAQRLEGRWRERVEASEGLAKFIRKQRAAVKDGEQQEDTPVRMRWQDVKQQAALGFCELAQQTAGVSESWRQPAAPRSRRHKPDPEAGDRRLGWEPAQASQLVQHAAQTEPASTEERWGVLAAMHAASDDQTLQCASKAVTPPQQASEERAAQSDAECHSRLRSAAASPPQTQPAHCPVQTAAEPLDVGFSSLMRRSMQPRHSADAQLRGGSVEPSGRAPAVHAAGDKACKIARPDLLRDLMCAADDLPTASPRVAESPHDARRRSADLHRMQDGEIQAAARSHGDGAQQNHADGAQGATLCASQLRAASPLELTLANRLSPVPGHDGYEEGDAAGDEDDATPTRAHTETSAPHKRLLSAASTRTQHTVCDSAYEPRQARQPAQHADPNMQPRAEVPRREAVTLARAQPSHQDSAFAPSVRGEPHTGCDDGSAVDGSACTRHTTFAGEWQSTASAVPPEEHSLVRSPLASLPGGGVQPVEEEPAAVPMGLTAMMAEIKELAQLRARIKEEMDAIRVTVSQPNTPAYSWPADPPAPAPSSPSASLRTHLAAETAPLRLSIAALQEHRVSQDRANGGQGALTRAHKFVQDTVRQHMRRSSSLSEQARPRSPAAPPAKPAAPVACAAPSESDPMPARPTSAAASWFCVTAPAERPAPAQAPVKARVPGDSPPRSPSQRSRAGSARGAPRPASKLTADRVSALPVSRTGPTRAPMPSPAQLYGATAAQERTAGVTAAQRQGRWTVSSPAAQNPGMTKAKLRKANARVCAFEPRAPGSLTFGAATEAEADPTHGVDGPLQRVGSYALAHKAASDAVSASPAKASTRKCLPPVLPSDMTAPAHGNWRRSDPTAGTPQVAAPTTCDAQPASDLAPAGPLPRVTSETSTLTLQADASPQRCTEPAPAAEEGYAAARARHLRCVSEQRACSPPMQQRSASPRSLPAASPRAELPAATQLDTPHLVQLFQTPESCIPKPCGKPAWMAQRGEGLNASFDREFADLAHDPEVIAMVADRCQSRKHARRQSHLPSTAQPETQGHTPTRGSTAAQQPCAPPAYRRAVEKRSPSPNPHFGRDSQEAKKLQASLDQLDLHLAALRQRVLCEAACSMRTLPAQPALTPSQADVQRHIAQVPAKPAVPRLSARAKPIRRSLTRGLPKRTRRRVPALSIAPVPPPRPAAQVAALVSGGGRGGALPALPDMHYALHQHLPMLWFPMAAGGYQC